MELYAWGANSHSQLGLNFINEQITTPHIVNYPGKVAEIKSICGGGGNTVILGDEGKIYACGWNNKGQLGLGDQTDRLVFEQVITCDRNLRFNQIFCGWETTAAITTNGELFIWGNNLLNSKPLPCCSPTQFALPYNEKVRTVSMGFQHICILTENNVLYFYGRLRNVKEFPSNEGWVTVSWNSLDFHKFTSNDEILLLSSGQHHFLLYFRSGLFKAYGDNRFGQVSVHNEILLDVNKVTCGWTHNACSTKAGSVYVWGRNNYGQVGNCRDQSVVASPIQLNILEKLNAIHLGSEHGMVLTETGNVFTWGWNEHGNCGDGSNENLYEPVQIPMPGKAILGGTGAGFCYVVVEKS